MQYTGGIGVLWVWHVYYSVCYKKSHSHTHQGHWFTGSLSVWSHGYRKLFGQFVTLVAPLSVVCIRVVTPYLMLPLGLKLLLPLCTA